ncbi:hypothetical protein E3N88_30879 [Mikania micrantha]|uniref:Uncharacterized protein n=1 Tax=Mikania micrantha TaxID=192012 RepID=A0A5N6MMV1_9ASTR|nr:hypothetical protein E3N88_30879 [Mikania micrantha]
MVAIRNQESRSGGTANPIAAQLEAIAAKLDAMESLKEDVAALKRRPKFHDRHGGGNYEEGKTSWRSQAGNRPFNKIDFPNFGGGDPRDWILKAEKKTLARLSSKIRMNSCVAFDKHERSGVSTRIRQKVWAGIKLAGSLLSWCHTPTSRHLLMMSLVTLRWLWKHSGDVSKMRYYPSVNILVPNCLNVYHYIKKFWKQITNIYTKGSCKLPANGLSADSTIIVFCSAPHGFTSYSSEMRTYQFCDSVLFSGEENKWLMFKNQRVVKKWGFPRLRNSSINASKHHGDSRIDDSAQPIEDARLVS